MHVLGDVGVDLEGQRGVGEVGGVQDGLAQQHAVLGALVAELLGVVAEVGGQREVSAHVCGHDGGDDDLADLLHMAEKPFLA